MSERITVDLTREEWLLIQHRRIAEHGQRIEALGRMVDDFAKMVAALPLEGASDEGESGDPECATDAMTTEPRP